MKAVKYEKYGAPEVLQIKEVEKPAPKENEVLVRVHATTATSGDVRMRKPDPAAVRLYNGITRPKRFTVLGCEFSGVIEAVGKNVTSFKAGDRVFGGTGVELGANVEYLCIAENAALATMPAYMSHEEAAAIPFGAMTSLFFLSEKGNIKRGQKVLIYGASGSLGVYAIQLAKYFGTDVTGVCSTANVELVKSLGADKVIDYTKEDFTRSGETYDIIFDTLGKSPFAGSVRSLHGNGIYLRAVHMDLSSILRGLWTSLTSKRKVVGGVAKVRKAQIELIKKLVESGELKPVIDRRYRLEDIVEAHRYVEKGRKKGSVVLTVGTAFVS